MTYLSNSDFTLFTEVETGNVFSSLSKLALMCGASKGSLGNWFARRPKLDFKMTEVVTAGGLQGVQLYDENTILEALYHFDDKGKKEAKLTLRSFSKTGLKVYIQNETQFNQAHESVQEATGMTPWDCSRKFTACTHNDFQNACKAKRHPAAQIHDLITSLVTGYTAQQARDGLELVKGDKTVGLNYQPSEEQLKVIGEAKRLYTTYRKGSWQDQARRAVFHASAD